MPSGGGEPAVLEAEALWLLLVLLNECWCVMPLGLSCSVARSLRCLKSSFASATLDLMDSANTLMREPNERFSFSGFAAAVDSCKAPAPPPE